MEEAKTYTWPQEADIRGWLQEIPLGGDRRELESRLHETDKGNRFSATFELILHHIFKKRGYSIERHPKIVGSTRTPDYKVEQSGFCFYLEAKAFADSEVQKLAEEGVVWSGQIDDIYGDLQEKSTRYGQLDSPYVIAIWSPENPTGQHSEMGFLFGDLGVRYEVLTKPGQKGSPARVVRRPNGLFVSYPAVSAVAVYEYVRVKDERRHEFRVYHNPEAVLPIDRSIFAGYPQAHRRKIAAGKYTIKWKV